MAATISVHCGPTPQQLREFIKAILWLKAATVCCDPQVTVLYVVATERRELVSLS